MGKLRIPREVEIAGLDYEMMESAKEDEQFHLQPGKGEKYGYSYKLDRSFKC